jgi:glycosyltransferase involved in cell wall biosynthesis
MRRAGFPGPLVLVGQDGWRFGPIAARLASSPEAAHVMRVRDADDTDLAALYGACTCCAFPSLAEGFGMPLLESMACGTACVVSDDPALRELGQHDCVAVPATDADALADAMLRLWREPDHRAAVAAGGPARARAYAFPRWAERIFALYRSLLERPALERSA